MTDITTSSLAFEYFAFLSGYKDAPEVIMMDIVATVNESWSCQ